MHESPWQRRAADFGRRIPAPLILVFALVLLQLSSGTAKIIMTPENAQGLAFLRMLIGAPLLWLVIRPKVSLMNDQQWKDVALLGVIYAIFTYVFYAALIHLPLGLVATIGFLGPLAVSIFSSRRALDLAWPALGLAGVFMLTPSGGDAELSWSALGYGFAYALAWAGYILASVRAGKSMNGLDGFVVATAIAAILLAPVGYSHAADFLGTVNMALMTLLVTLLITIPLGLEYLVLKRIEPRVFGVLLSLEPAIATVVGIFLLFEIPSPMSWLAIAAVTTASIGATLGRVAHGPQESR